MLDILREHLATTATPELLAVLEKAHDVLDRLGRENYEEGFEEILLTQEHEISGDTDTVTAVVRLTAELIGQALTEHGVAMTEESLLAVRVDLLVGLLDVMEIEVTDPLISAVWLTGRPEEVFAEVLGQVTRYAPDEILQHVDEVSPALIKRMREVIVPSLQASEEDVVTPVHLEKFRALQRLTKGTDLEATKLLGSSMYIGATFATYVTLIKDRIEHWTPQQAAYNLLGFALLSSDGLYNPRQVIQAELEKLVTSIERITQIDVVLLDYTVRIQHYE